MSSFFGAAARILALSMVVGFAALLFLPSVDGPVLAGLSIPDPAPSSCKKQHWPNVDRGCLWNEAKREPARAVAKAETPTPPTKAQTAKVETAQPVNPNDAIPSSPVSEAPPPIAAPIASGVADLRPALAADLASAKSDNAAPARPALRRSDKQKPPRNGLVASAEDIPISVVRADGTRRTVLIRPTSPQDVYYYSQRSLAAALPPARL